jgi:hypothetical protein
MSNELSTPRILLCPQDRQRKWATNFDSGFSNSNVSYFVGIDATKTNSAMFMAGDRDLTNGLPVVRGTLTLNTNRLAGWAGQIHTTGPRGSSKGPGGVLLLADGVVQFIDRSGLNEKLQASKTRNRLSIP